MKKELLSASDRYLKKTNRIVLIVGLVMALAFLIGLLSLIDLGGRGVEDTDPDLTATVDPFAALNTGNNAPIALPTAPAEGSAKLEAKPEALVLDPVVLGTKAESVITLIATGGKIRIVSVDLEEPQQDGFSYESKCEPNQVLSADATCNIRVFWKPVMGRSLQNNLAVRWTEEGGLNVTRKLIVTVAGVATDTSLCGVCEAGPLPSNERQDCSVSCVP